MNKNNRVVNYTLSGLIPHSQHIVRVTADSNATDTVPEELAHLRSLNLTLMTLSEGKETLYVNASKTLLHAVQSFNAFGIVLIMKDYNGICTGRNFDVNLMEYLLNEARHLATIAPSVFQMSCFNEQLFSVMYKSFLLFQI